MPWKPCCCSTRDHYSIPHHRPISLIHTKVFLQRVGTLRWAGWERNEPDMVQKEESFEKSRVRGAIHDLLFQYIFSAQKYHLGSTSICFTKDQQLAGQQQCEQRWISYPHEALLQKCNQNEILAASSSIMCFYAALLEVNLQFSSCKLSLSLSQCCILRRPAALLELFITLHW